jgi:hypothetical protein
MSSTLTTQRFMQIFNTHSSKEYAGCLKINYIVSEMCSTYVDNKTVDIGPEMGIVRVKAL